MTSGPASIRQLIATHGQLRRWQSETSCRLRQLDQIRALLPQEARPHCVGVRVAEGTLVVFADSSAWATRLRYGLPSIIPQLGVRKLRVRVAAPEPVAKQAPETHRRLPAEAASLLEMTADSVTDPKLSEILRRLAAHGGKGRQGP